MDIRNVATFLRVCDLESLTKAAVVLNYAQSTVTAQIQQLERELGFPLFDRVGRKVALTSLGREFLPLAENMVNIQQQAYALNSSSLEMRGTLRVGVLESLLFGTLVHILPKYERMYPCVDLQVKMGNLVDLLTWLKQNQLDLVYLSGDQNIEPELCCCYKRQERFAFVGSARHPLAGRGRVSLAEFLAYPIVDTERTGYCYGRLKKLASAQGLPLRHSIVVDNTKAICEILKSGVYLSFLPLYSVAEELCRGALAEIPVDAEPQIYYSQILHYFDKWVPPFMSEFIDLIRQCRPER